MRLLLSGRGIGGSARPHHIGKRKLLSPVRRTSRAGWRALVVEVIRYQPSDARREGPTPADSIFSEGALHKDASPKRRHRRLRYRRRPDHCRQCPLMESSRRGFGYRVRAELHGIKADTGHSLLHQQRMPRGGEAGPISTSCDQKLTCFATDQRKYSPTACCV